MEDSAEKGLEDFSEERVETNITIEIKTIENIVRNDRVSLSFRIEHNDVIIGESSMITIEPDPNDPPPVHDVDFLVDLRLDAGETTVIESLVSTPILITALYSKEREEVSQMGEGDGKKKKSKPVVKSGEPISGPLGVCSLDLMPILLGDQLFAEKLPLESPRFSLDENLVSWQNLPLLTVVTNRIGSPIFSSADEEPNFFYITIESVYNPPESFGENSDYKAGTIIYTGNETPENVIFENGTWTNYRDVERTKRWNTLIRMENRARLSKYRIDRDHEGVKNKYRAEFDLAKEVCQDAPRIEWNSMNRSLARPNGLNALKKQITRYKYWPFQFVVSERSSETSRQRVKEKSENRAQLYQCYADFSELLYPGRSSTRVVAQLYTYNPIDITEKVGLETSTIFGTELQLKETTEKPKKGKSSKHSQSIHSEPETRPSNPLTGADGRPTVVVVHAELLRPLIPCRVEEDFSSFIDEISSAKKGEPRSIYSSLLAEDHYTNCVQKLADVITESFRDFREEHENDEERTEDSCEAQEDELSRFTQYLYRTGVYLSVRNTLKGKVTMLLDQKFKFDSTVLDRTESQNFIASVYTYLVEKMRLSLNKAIEGRLVEDRDEMVDRDKLHFNAEEAYELNRPEEARRYYKKAIEEDQNDPECWIRYGVFCLRVNDTDRAVECCREALSLDRRNKIGLLLYAGILFQRRDYKQAEIFFKALTEFHPRFTEAWIALHLFYIRTEYHPGADLVFRVGQKCLRDKDRDTRFLEDEPLAWSTIHCPRNNAYLTTAALLLKLHLCDLAGIALAQEMSVSDRSVPVVYYLAVEHYLSGRYENALSHLEEARGVYGMDYSISSLIGHCLHRIGDIDAAIETYQYGYALFDRPDDVHLVELRMGRHYIETGDYERAKKVFVGASKRSATSQTCLGAGISFYKLGQFDEAEAALTAANEMNSTDPEVWAYLCLLNISLRRVEEFGQCYAQALKNNLECRKLWLTIKESMEALGYVPAAYNTVAEARDDYYYLSKKN